MPAAKQTEPDATNKSLEMNIERNVRALNRAGDERAANTIATLLRRVCEASTYEIDNLIGHAKLSQAVMQLTAIGSDSVENLPRAPRISQ
jgi:hypothetical protein